MAGICMTGESQATSISVCVWKYMYGSFLLIKFKLNEVKTPAGRKTMADVGCSRQKVGRMEKQSVKTSGKVRPGGGKATAPLRQCQ